MVKEKCIYASLNRLEPKGAFLRGEFWVPKKYEEKLVASVEKIGANKNIERPSITPWKKQENMQEPSLFEDNEFTWAFAEIVNTYGVPNYKEVNPAVFACVTFPFLFGFMFGDIMHGTLLTVGGIICIINADKWRNTSLKGFVAARYLLLLMGLCALFAGFCYNDFTSLPLHLFG